MVVRSDENLNEQTRTTEEWDGETYLKFRDDPIDQSFSGNERNRWYYNYSDENGPGGRSFADLSTLTGMDSDADGRGFARWDFNRDGQVDIALCNANAPILNLYENRIRSGNNFVAINFMGGSQGGEPTKGLSPRDGYGAVVTLELEDGQTLEREFRCGEGFSAQNSDTMIIGIGRAVRVEQASIRWSSGRVYQAGQIEANQRITFFEQSKDGPAHEVAAY